MKLSDVPDFLIKQFEEGYAPGDEPPGMEEMAYKAWKEAGGTKIRKTVKEMALERLQYIMDHSRATWSGPLLEELASILRDHLEGKV